MAKGCREISQTGAKQNKIGRRVVNAVTCGCICDRGNICRVHDAPEAIISPRYFHGVGWIEVIHARATVTGKHRSPKLG